MDCLWLSNRAGEGAAGSSASVDMLSRMVPITTVLEVQGSEVTPGSRGQKVTGCVSIRKVACTGHFIRIMFTYKLNVVVLVEHV